MTNTHGVKVVINELRDELIAWGIDIPSSLKRRDPKEPGRKEKEEIEDKLFAAFMSQFRKQKKGISDMLTSMAPDRKALGYLDYLGDDFWIDDDFVAIIIRLFTKAAKHGIILFDASVGLTMDYTLTNVAAAKWASKYTYKLVKKIDDTTRGILRTAFKTFVDTPGMTIGDVVKMLPYDESRALMIATTETTRIYAEAEILAGKALKEEYPDVKIIVTWWTNMDPPRLCELCEALHGKEIEQGGLFEGGFAGPPRHVGCRCWTTTTTRLANA